LYQSARARVNWACKYGFRIVYVDETYFSSKTFKDRTFNAVGKNHSFPRRVTEHTRVACTMAVSAEYGVEAYCLTTGAMNGNFFSQILGGVRDGGGVPQEAPRHPF
jgi:hypothetical protein